MVDFERFAQILDELTNNLPKEIFVKLNGGVNLIYEAKEHPESIDGSLSVLGDYNYNNLGRYINIYYGSFMGMFGHYSEEMLKGKIDHTLKHEFVHHLESLAGEKDLIIADAQFIARYKASLSDSCFSD